MADEYFYGKFDPRRIPLSNGHRISWAPLHRNRTIIGRRDLCAACCLLVLSHAQKPCFAGAKFQWRQIASKYCGIFTEVLVEWWQLYGKNDAILDVDKCPICVKSGVWCLLYFFFFVFLIYIHLTFWHPGVTLSDSNRSVTWDPEIKDDYPCNFKLIIKQILLGHEAAANAYNVVQVRRRNEWEITDFRISP